MFNKLKSVFKRLSEKLTIPAAAFGVIGVSTTLACCYGPPPDYPVEDFETVDACEKMLCECAQAHGLWADECTSGAIESCEKTVSSRAMQAWNKSPSTSENAYSEYLLQQLNNGEITAAAALEAGVSPWMNCYASGASEAESCSHQSKLLKVADLLQNAQFKDKNVRWVAARYALASDREGLRARGYELAAAAIETDVAVDPSVAKVLEMLGAESNAYALRIGLESFAIAVIETAKRIKAAGDAALLDAAKVNLQTLDVIANAAKSNEYAEVQAAVTAIIEQLGAFE